jgi:YcxB-like protein
LCTKFSNPAYSGRQQRRFRSLFFTGHRIITFCPGKINDKIAAQLLALAHNNSTGMTIQFGYDKKQVLQALRYHFLSRPEIKTLIILVNVFAILSAVLFALRKIQGLSFLIFSFLWISLMVIIWRILPASIYRGAATFRDNFSMRFEEEGVELSNQHGSKTWPWKNFSHLLESPHFFHLYFDARSFFLVPKDAFNDVGQLQAARELIKQKIKKPDSRG